MIYLDNNATTRPLPKVIEAMNSALQDCWANPSSKHALGQAAKSDLIAARGVIAAFVGAQPNEVVFTSGATEANVQVLNGVLQRPGVPRRIILSCVEHAAFIKAAMRLRQDGVEVVLLPVDRAGQVEIAALNEALQQEAALISVMAANNETGVLQPIEEIAAIARQHQVPMHVDATQMLGKLPLSFARWGIDLMSVSAHKLHGPKGVGALVIRKGLLWPPLMAGQQERGRRGGTENVPGIVGFAAAVHHANETLMPEAYRLNGLRETFEAMLLQQVAGIKIYGHASERLPNTVCLTIAGLSSDKILERLERKGIYASSGAACSSAGTEPSHVLLSMGVPSRVAMNAVRLSLGLDNTLADLHQVVDVLQELSASSRPVNSTDAKPFYPQQELTR